MSMSRVLPHKSPRNLQIRGKRRGVSNRSDGSQRGYTLIEVVVAFALLAFGLTLLLSALTNAVRQVRGASDSGRAALHAQSILDQVGYGEALTPGHRDGTLDEGRYRWAMDVKPYVEAAGSSQDAIVPGAPQLLELQLSVTWGDGGPRQQLHVDSLRLVTPTDLKALSAAP